MGIACPHCQTIMRWSEEYWGKKLRCPKCKQIFVIQKPSEEKVTPVSSEQKSSHSLYVKKETEKLQKDIASKRPGFDDQIDICAGCGRTIAANEAAYEVEGRMFCMACEGKLPDQTTSKSQQKAGVADEIQVKCKKCQNIYFPNLKSNKAWICPNCKGKNPNLKRHYRSVADLCILGLIGQSLLLYAGLVRVGINLSWILGFAHAVLLLVTIICTYRSVAPWMDQTVKSMIAVVYSVATLGNILFFLLVFPPLMFPVAAVYAIIWAYLFWLWFQTKQCTV